MRLSLSVEGSDEACSKCGDNDTDALVFKVVAIVDGYSGEAEPLCARCMDGGIKSDVPMEPLVTGPAPRRKALRANQKTSLRQELDIQEEFGARRQPGSGNQAGAKGDNRKKGELRLEAKFTRDNSYRLQLDDLYKVAGEATLGELPVLVIDFLEPGIRKLRDRFAVIHAADLKELLNGNRRRTRSSRQVPTELAKEEPR